MISWDTCRRDFEPDGALRDIYVLDTNIKHWQRLFAALVSAYALEYSVDGESRPVPETVDEALRLRATASPSLHFRVAGIVVACHFFCTEQIELDIDPREVTSAAAFDEVLGLLRVIGDIVSKRVIMTYESDEQHPFIIYEPSTRKFEHHQYMA
jgi:hypothetical protein